MSGRLSEKPHTLEIVSEAPQTPNANGGDEPGRDSWTILERLGTVCEDEVGEDRRSSAVKSPASTRSPTSPCSVKRKSKRTHGTLIENSRTSTPGGSPVPPHRTAAFLETCKETFQRYDTDESGSIDADELYAALRSAGVEIAPKAIHQLITEVDVNNDGEINFEEFLSLVEKCGLPNETYDAAQNLGTITLDVGKILARRQAQMMKIETKDIDIIKAKTAAICPQHHDLMPMTLTELEHLPYFFGAGGFVCGNCGIHSDNLVLKNCKGCAECEYVVCDACYIDLKTQLVDDEISRRITSRRNNLWTYATSPKTLRKPPQARRAPGSIKGYWEL